MNIKDELHEYYGRIEENILTSNEEGYWSNLDKDENTKLISAIKHMSTKEAIRKYHGWLFDIIFSPKRAVGLELIDLTGDEACVDYGCMWGALTIPLAKRCRYVLGIDQTLDSLKFLNIRLREEKLTNVSLLCENLTSIQSFMNTFDIAIVNGVLEWIPEEGTIELKSYYGKPKSKQYSGNPGYKQENFLRKVYKSLKNNGKLYLAIENRYDFKMFLGVKDPHANLLFISFLPRAIANWISWRQLGRPYVNWLYSFNGIKFLLKKVGFSKVDLFMCFPDYRFPEKIIPYESSLENFTLTISSKNARGKRTVKRLLGRSAEYLIFKIFKLKYLAPSIIAVASK